MSKRKIINASFMKILVLLFIFCVSKTYSQDDSFPILSAVDLNFTPASNGYSVGVEYFIPLGMMTGVGLGGCFGFEKSTRLPSSVSSDEIMPSVLSGMSGDVLNSYSYVDLESGYQFGFKTSFQRVIVVGSHYDKEKKARIIEKWFILSLGLRYIFHPKVHASYRVESEDLNYIYTDYVDVPFADSFFKIAPEIGFQVKWFGMAYSYQRDVYKNPLHTLTLRMSIPRY